MLRTKMDPKRSALLFSIVMLLMVVPSVGFAQTETVLYTFTGAPSSGPDAAFPSYGSLAIDSQGNLYGTTTEGGAFGSGTVYSISSQGKETLLYSFTGGSDGLAPQAIMVSGAALYGTTEFGGTKNSECAIGCGTVFKLTGVGKESVIHSFAGVTSDGAYPFGGVIRDAAGNLYGTTSGVGTRTFGSVYELAVSGNERFYTFRHAPDGAFPWGSLVRGSNGTLYGTTEYGGENYCASEPGSCGTVFQINSAGESIIYSFGTSTTDGAYPQSGLIEDAAGNLYGTASAGGKYGYGAVFELSKVKGTWKETILYNFAGWPDGGYPSGSLIQDAQGNLYGTTPGGGQNNEGTVFKVTSAGQETVLYSFTGYADGGAPSAGVVLDKEGNLYGTTSKGGDWNCAWEGCGVVFKLTP